MPMNGLMDENKTMESNRTSAAVKNAVSTQSVDLSAMRYQPLKIAVALEVGREVGIALGDLLSGSDLSSAAIENPETRTSVDQFLCVVRNLLRHYPHSDAGLKVGQRIHLSSFGMYGYAMLCADTFRHACDIALRYHLLGTPVMAVHFEDRGDKAVWLFTSLDQLPLESLEPELQRFLLELQFLVHIVGTRDTMGAACVAARARMTLSEPAHAEALAQAFGCPIEFNQPVNELHYAASWLERKPTLANPIVAAQISMSLAEQLGEFQWQAGFSRRVYEELTRTPGHFPEMEEIAATLCMTSRHLRRKLQEEGSSYKGLLVNVRHALAKDYLTSSTLSSEDIAAALGFSDAASFRHAFKRWVGMSPSDFRASSART